MASFLYKDKADLCLNQESCPIIRAFFIFNKTKTQRGIYYAEY